MVSNPARLTALASQVTRIRANTARPPLSVTKLPRQSRDAPVLAELLELHAVSRPTIVDCTYGSGAIWGRLPIRRQVIKVDIRGLPGVDLVSDWLDLPRHFAPGSIDVLVWDPIQVADVGHNSTLYTRYVAAENPVKGDDVTALFPGFFDMARAVVRPRTGILLAKMCDQVHGGRYRWQTFALVAEAQRRGWTACQPRVQFNPHPMPIGGAKTRYHTRNDVAYWLVLRNGPDCHGPGQRVKHELTCGCGHMFWARRADAMTCSPKCRKQRSRDGATPCNAGPHATN